MRRFRHLRTDFVEEAYIRHRFEVDVGIVSIAIASPDRTFYVTVDYLDDAGQIDTVRSRERTFGDGDAPAMLQFLGRHLDAEAVVGIVRFVGGWRSSSGHGAG